MTNRPPPSRSSEDTPTFPMTEPVSAPASIESQRRFLPGTIFGSRYRIVELLGKGGMGEVYRAEDLQLGQAVALKFLPADLAGNDVALARLRTEVRLARQISHPNVCTVYDISEVEGQHFFSMEYVDGETLASVLRRMGRPTKEKNHQIALQLCTGLAAAHDKGVLHRDLKPANIMIDGRGRVRIMDFGLASFARAEVGTETHAGTPGYMAPEQLAGKGSSPKSDIYSLGLILYELATGKPAFEADSIAQLRKLHETSNPKPPSSCVDDVDPDLDRLIMQCLEKDPADRPSSVWAVAAVLPGGDLLASSLAAGETPTPEMVAAAGGRGALSLTHATVAMVAILAGLIAIAALNSRVSLPSIAPPQKPPVVMADRAREILKHLGRTDTPADRADGLFVNEAYLDHIRSTDTSPNRWQQLSRGRPTAYVYWYRESPTSLIASNLWGKVTLNDPPLTISGMAAILLDAGGRLGYFEMVPPQVDETPPSDTPTDFSPLFTAAGLDMATFRSTQPIWNPGVYADERLAWEGHYPGQPEIPLRIEAAGYRGQPVFFHLIDPFDKPWRVAAAVQEPLRDKLVGVLGVALFLLALVASVVIARHNLRLGRGDRKGAFRVGTFITLIFIILYATYTDFPGSPKTAFIMFEKALGLALFVGIWVGCAYLALEPYARKLWPEVLISWTRLLMGHVRDPRVGRDVLIGGVVGVLIVLLQQVETLIPTWFGFPGRAPCGSKNALMGGWDALAMIFDPDFLLLPVLLLLLLTGVRSLFRRQWVAVAITLVVFFLVEFDWMAAEVVDVTGVSAVVEMLLISGLCLFLLIRVGLLALVVSIFFAMRLQQWPLTLDMSTWFAGTSVMLLVVLTLITIYSFRTSVAGVPPTTQRLVHAGA